MLLVLLFGLISFCYAPNMTEGNFFTLLAKYFFIAKWITDYILVGHRHGIIRETCVAILLITEPSMEDKVSFIFVFHYTLVLTVCSFKSSLEE